MKVFLRYFQVAALALAVSVLSTGCKEDSTDEGPKPVEPSLTAELVAATYTAEQIAARRAGVKITVAEGSDETPDAVFHAMLAADTFHTFAEWKRMGYSVKKGQHAALVCNLWKYTDKPGKAAKEAAAAAGQDAPETDPHFYMAKSHLFNALQVEKSKR